MAAPVEGAALDECAEVLLERVATDAGQLDGIADRDAAMLAGEFDDLQLQFRHRCQHGPFALDLRLQPPYLFSQRAQEERQPWLPVRGPGANGALRPAQRQVVRLLALLDDTLERAVVHIGVSGLKKQQCRQHAGEPPIAVLERVNLQKHHDTHGDDQQRMQTGRLALLIHPGHQLRHQAGRVEGRCGLEHNADSRAGLVEGSNAVRKGLVLAAVAGVLLAVIQQDLVQLLDLVLGERDVPPRRDHEVHQLGIAGHFLLVARGERPYFEVRQQLLHLAVGQLAALDAG